MDIETINMRVRKGEKLKDIVPEHKVNAYRQKLYRYRKKLQNEKPIIDKVTQEWINEAKNHYFAVYTLDVYGSLYIGCTGDLEARFYQHRKHTFSGQKCKIIACEFFYDKDDALEREKEIIFWYSENGYDMKNTLITRPQLKEINLISSPQVTCGDVTFHSGYIMPSYIGFINWCRKHLEIPFAAQMVQHCEDNKRKHWRSIVINTFELLTYYFEEG